jgi:hypothetical protein
MSASAVSDNHTTAHLQHCTETATALHCIAYCIASAGSQLVSTSSTVLASHTWSNGRLLSASTLTAPVLGLCCTSEGTTVACSASGVSFWQSEASGKLRRRRGIRGRTGGSVSAALCCAAVGGGGKGVVTGTADGRLVSHSCSFSAVLIVYAILYELY